MIRLPAAAEPLRDACRGVFTRPTLQRFLVLMTGLIVTMGRRTVSRALAVMEPMIEGHWCNYHRLYSQARFSMWKLGMVLTRQVVSLLPVDRPIVLIADDTVDEKNGDSVWAKGAHRDAARSTRGRTGVTFGHKWLVMCVLVHLPGMARPWALPILCGLCRTEKVAKRIGKRPQSPSTIARQMLVRLMSWFPDRKFILLGDARAISHATACFARRHPDRVMGVSRLRADGNLYSPPKGRRKKGRKLPAPREQIKQLQPQRTTVAWYGSSVRQLRHASDTALWYSKHNNQVVPIRWVCVLGDKKQRLEDAYFYCSDPTITAARIIELYALRWNIEVTFEETRALLGLETTRHWCRQSVLRVTPILFGIFSTVALVWNQLSKRKEQECLSQTPCYRKSSMTFSDALYLVRRELWQESLMEHRSAKRCLSSIPKSLRQTILWHLAAAA